MESTKLAEIGICSILFLRPEHRKNYTDKLTPEHFIFPQTKSVFNAIKNLVKNDKAIDSLSVFNQIEKDGISKFDSVKQLDLILTEEISDINIETYSEIILEEFGKRELTKFKNKLSKIIEEINYDNFSEKVGSLEADLKKISIHQSTTLESLSSILARFWRDFYKEENQKFKLGIREVDEIMGGFSGGNLIVIGARPSIGKTTLLINICTNFVQNYSKNTLYYTFEMTKNEVGAAAASRISKVSLARIKGRKLSGQEASDFVETINKEFNNFFHIDSLQNNYDIDKLKSSIRDAVRANNATLVGIDYLQLLSGTNNSKNGREQEISMISRALKGLALELNITIIVLSQLNRRLESREDKIPTLSDLRDSGAIEQDADIVMFIHREAFYKRTPQNENEATISIAKNRHGKTGICNIKFYGDIATFGVNKNENF